MNNKQTVIDKLMDDFRRLINFLVDHIDSYRKENQEVKAELESMKIDFGKRLEYLEHKPFNLKE